MGRPIDISIQRDVIQLSLVPGQDFPFTNEPFFSIIKGSDDEILAYEIKDIYLIEEEDIPDISGKFDVIGTDMKDKTIREIVFALKESSEW